MPTSKSKQEYDEMNRMIGNILHCCVGLSFQIISKSASVFNDQFEALLDEKLRDTQANAGFNANDYHQECLILKDILDSYKENLASLISSKRNYS
jgi:hypothetical protein